MGRKVCIVIMEQQIELSNAIFLELAKSNETYQKETCLFSTLTSDLIQLLL